VSFDGEFFRILKLPSQIAQRIEMLSNQRRSFPHGELGRTLSAVAEFHAIAEIFQKMTV
jgi:hypothetical protein